MSIAHIMIEIQEDAETGELNARLTYSGGSEMETPEGQTAFQKTLKAVETALSE